MGGSSAADWIAAIGQAVGAIGTLAAVLVALWIARRDARRFERDRQDREAGQARLVTGRVDEKWSEIVHNKRSHVVVVNNGAQAVTNLKLLAVQAEGRAVRWDPVGTRHPGVEVLAAGATVRFDGVWLGEGEGKGKIKAVDVRVELVDSAGGWWQRVGNDAVVRSPRRLRPAPVWWEKPAWETGNASRDETGAGV